MPERPAAGHSPPGEGFRQAGSLLSCSLPLMPTSPTVGQHQQWVFVPASDQVWAHTSGIPHAWCTFRKGLASLQSCPQKLIGEARWSRWPGGVLDPKHETEGGLVEIPGEQFWYWPPRVRFRWRTLSSTRPPSRQPPTAVFRLPSPPTFLTNWIQIQEFPLLKPPPTPSFSSPLEFGKHRLLTLPQTIFPPFFQELASHQSGLNTNASFSENFSNLPTVSQSCYGVLLPWWHLSEIHCYLLACLLTFSFFYHLTMSP